MTTTEILETAKSWASQRFTPEAGQLEVSEKLTPPPFVDLPSDSADRSGVFLGLKHVDGRELQVWISSGGEGGAYCIYDENDGEIETFALPKFDTTYQLEEKLNDLAEEFSESGEFNDLDDDDRVDCPFCGHTLYPGNKTATDTGWVWMGDVCKHTLFFAIDISAFSGFEYRSKLFNEHLGLPDSDDAEITIFSGETYNGFRGHLSVQEIIEKISLPGLELRSYDDEGGIACGPCGGGTLTFGFVPQGTEPAGK